MDILVSILSSAGVSAALTAGLIFLAKTTIAERLKNAIKNEYDLKLELYKSELATASTKEIESLKAQLQITASRQQIQFASLHEKTAETVAQVYARIISLNQAAVRYVSIVEFDPGPTKEERRTDLNNKLNAFDDCYKPSKIYLPKTVVAKIDAYDKLLFGTVERFKHAVELPEAKRGAVNEEEWARASRTIGNALPPVLAVLEDEFRKLLGHSPSESE